ncbi:hypothetical protein [Devosia sp. CN2-171]|uniref:hypothetical protein n=1 Tax=Devosia sp. CN2-171 TaxID=3400909 RepID=UPI003BF921EC
MKGAEFVDLLAAQLQAKSDSDLAKKLGFTPAHVSSTRKMDELSARRLSSFLERLRNHSVGALLREAVHPIVEFFFIEYNESRSGKNMEIIGRSEHPELADVLSNARGIYAFYNSEGEIVYIGKAEKQSLLKEMKLAFNRERPSYNLMAVGHPRGKWKPNTPSSIRQIRPTNFRLYDTCSYFSAYSVSGDLITALESFLIRVVPNDVVNVRMEKGRSKTAIDEWQ